MNLAASLRARLATLARRRGVELQLVLSEFAVERLLFRLGRSPHAERYVLKGAQVFNLWYRERGRATWDLDLLGHGPNAVEDVARVARDLCALEADDGIVFDAHTIKAEEIRAPDEYTGVRVRMEARLGTIRIPVQLDVGFGDAVVPPPRLEEYPTLLDLPAPRVLAYPREAVIAEKVEAIVSLGEINTRMKDFYDIQRLARLFPFDGPTLVRAIRATFERRGTPLPAGEPAMLAAAVLAAPERAVQWRAFVRRGRLDAPDAAALTEDLRRFVLPVLAAARSDGSFTSEWPAGGPWREHST